MAERAAAPSPGLRMEILPALKRHVLRCREGQIEAGSKRLGIDLPCIAYGSASADGVHALWLGPDEWLVLAGKTLPTGLWAEIGASFVDVSHRQVAIGLSGWDVEMCLSTGCPLDLALPAFPIGACTRTLYHKAEVVLWRTAKDRFHIEVWRSFAPYVQMLLSEAIRDRT